MDICMYDSLNPTQYKHKVLSESSTLFFVMAPYRSRLYCPIFGVSCCLRLQDEMSNPWPLPSLRPGIATGTLRRNLRTTYWEPLVYTLVHTIYIYIYIYIYCRRTQQFFNVFINNATCLGPSYGLPSGIGYVLKHKYLCKRIFEIWELTNFTVSFQF